MFGPMIRQWDMNIYTGPGDSLGLTSNPNYDPHITEFILGNLCYGESFLDIGAHIGYYSLLASKIVGPNGIVHAWEASPKARKIMWENIRINNIENIELFDYAIGAEDSDVTFYEQKEGWGQNSFNSSLVDRGEYEAISVKQYKLDSFFKDCWVGDDPMVIKSDTQGYDVNVLKGAQGFINRGIVKAMALEIWPKGLEAMGSNVKELYDLIGPNYSIVTHVIDPGNRYHLVPCNYEQAMSIFGNGSGQREHGDLLCIRKK